MLDVRETILLRLKALLDLEADGTGLLARAYRNTNELPEQSRPCGVLFDGAEEAADQDHKRHGNSPRRITMRPQILLLVSEQPENVGAALSAVRAALMYRLLDDTELNGLSLNGEGIVYEGCTPFIQSGRVIEGTMLLSFSILYLLKPADLAP